MSPHRNISKPVLVSSFVSFFFGYLLRKKVFIAISCVSYGSINERNDIRDGFLFDIDFFPFCEFDVVTLSLRLMPFLSWS